MLPLKSIQKTIVYLFILAYFLSTLLTTKTVSLSCGLIYLKAS